ncbi:hypothetical protein BKI52_28965 [marine bacterium AO1-C]|nr:hypothetical protein BKI52_28965 [marine bacterium AO1-C]
MKWNTAYHVYEIIALLLIALSWWSWVTDSGHYETSHWQALNNRLEYGLALARTQADKADTTLRKEVKKTGNSREGLARIKRMELLRKRTNEVMADLHNTIQHLKIMPEDGYRQANDWMVKEGAANRTKQILDYYVDWLASEFNDLSLPKFEKIAEGNQENSLYYEREADKDFTHNYFDNTSPEEAIAILTQKQLIIKRYEAEVLKRLGGGCCFCGSWKFNRIDTKTFAPVNTIQVGDEYTADMFIQSSASKANPRMSINQTPLMVKDGQADVAFKAQTIGKQFWEGKITLKIRGRDSTFIHRVPFEVLPK